MPTLLPEPVVPATRQCGILARSATTGLPTMSLPRPMVSMRRRVVVDLRAQDLGQADRLPARVGQLQRHVVLARDHLDHADADQRQRARQVLGQVDDLRALHAGGRLDLVARDHRAGRGRHHPHLDAEVLELLLDQPAGHLQRLGRHRFLAPGRGVEQVHLRQLGVGQFGEQRLLALLGHALATWASRHRRLDHQRHVLSSSRGARSSTTCSRSRSGLLTQARSSRARAASALTRRPSRRSPMASATAATKTQRQRHAHHQQRDPQHARAGKTQPAHRQRPQRVAQHAAGMPGTGPPSGTGASTRARSWRQQQRQPQPERQRGGCARARAAQARASADSQARSVTGTSHQAEKPNRNSSQVGHPGADAARPPVAQRRRPCPRW
jgi:hypothetical protein